MITDRQYKFVLEYCKDFMSTKAYIRAGYSEGGAASGASLLLKNPKVQEAIEERKAELAVVARLTPAWVLRQWHDIASADPNDIVKIEVNSCGNCYDSGTRECLIGAGLRDSLRTPNPDCKLCGGLGIGEVRISDTRTLKGSARRLYAGAQKTKDGIKVLMRDQDAALQNISRYLGMVVERKELSGPGGGPVPLASLNVNDLTDEQLMAFIAGENPKIGGTIEGTLMLAYGNSLNAEQMQEGSNP